MKTKQTGLQLLTVVSLFVITTFIASCRKTQDPVSLDVVQAAGDDAAVSAQTTETDDIANNVLTQVDAPTGRFQTFNDGRLECAKITLDTLDNGRVSGKATIDFDSTSAGVANPDGCTDAKGNVRKGRIIVTWANGRWFNEDATYTITYDGYSINGVKFSNDDSRVFTNVTSSGSVLTWTLVANHSLTWPDGTIATRVVHQTRQWIRSQTVTDDVFKISQTAGADNAAHGTSRRGRSYNVQIVATLEYDRACAISNKVFIPVRGAQLITIDGTRTLATDYGDGTCDNTVTISIEGRSVTITASNN